MGARTLAYRELDALATAAARSVADAGARAGGRYGVPAGRPLDFAVLLHALPRVGAALAPLDPRLADEDVARVARAGRLDGVGFAGLPPNPEPPQLRATVDPAETHSIIFTSGTTAEPRAVELTYANHHASAVASAERMGVDPDDRWLCPLPLFHVGGLAILLRSAIYGTTAVLHERFDTERVKSELETGAITIVSLVPTMLRRLRDAGLRRPPRLRAILLGGGPIPHDLLDWARGEQLPVMATYGMTEAASQIATGAPGEAGGRALPGAELEIGPDGEILVRGPMVAAGALAEDGWLHTGDRGRLDDDGMLHVDGRLKEVIVTGGENVSPLEVEAVLHEHPAVADAGVVGLPDPEWGEAVTAFVVLRGTGEVSEEDLRAHCRERLAPFKVPKRLHAVPELPRNAAGKLLRRRLVGSAG